MPRTKQRTPELRDHVMSVATATLLAEQGVAGFTARAIARQAQTSTPAVYELFGDKWGLVRAVYFEGFRFLRYLDALVETDDPRADLVELLRIYRRFMCENPELSELMFSRPFTDFDPGPSEREAGSAVRIFIVERVARCIDGGHLRGEATDVAHVLVALTQGMAGAENASRLGTTAASIDRRWDLALNAVLDGLATVGPSYRS